MSVKALTWAFDVDGDLPSPAKFVLIAIADAASEEGVCFPSIRRICRKTNLQRSTVVKYIADLEDRGLLSRVKRHREDGSYTSNEYRLSMKKVVRETDGVVRETDHLVRETDQGGSPDGQGVVRETDGGSPRDGHHEPSFNRNKEHKKKSANDYSPEFEKAWSLYPKREGGNPKAPAWKAWKARVKEGASVADLIAGTERYARYIRAKGDEGSRFVKQASTFFGPDGYWRESYEVKRPSVAPSRESSASDPNDWLTDPYAGTGFRGNVI